MSWGGMMMIAPRSNSEERDIFENNELLKNKIKWVTEKDNNPNKKDQHFKEKWKL